MTADRPAYRTLAQLLRNKILDGSFRPGDRLPAEGELATRTGVGRSTIREAIRALETLNLVITTRGVKGGTFVAEPDPAALSESLGIQLDFLTGSARITVADLIDAREAIELPAAGLAARRAGGSGGRLLETIPPNREGDTSPLDHNWRFHSAVVHLAGNPLFELLAAPILEVLETRFDRTRLPATHWATIDDDHLQIADRIGSGDEAGAREAMRVHLGTVRRTYAVLEEGSDNS